MKNTPIPETFEQTLERIDLADLLIGFVAPERVRRWGFNDLEFFAREHGFKFVREHGNLYGRLRLVPLEPAAPAPVLRVITRSDHAAVTGSAAPLNLLSCRLPPEHRGHYPLPKEAI